MNRNHQVLSALLDDEPFDGQELVTTLSDPAGRDLLVDLVHLRRIVQPSDAPPTPVAAPARGWLGWRAVAAAAVVVLALAGGYVAGERRDAESDTEAPQPTRIVEAVPFTPEGDTP